MTVFDEILITFSLQKPPLFLRAIIGRTPPPLKSAQSHLNGQMGTDHSPFNNGQYSSILHTDNIHGKW